MWPIGYSFAVTANGWVRVGILIDITDGIPVDYFLNITTQRGTMGNRNFPNWIKGYMEYTDDFEPPKAFNLWTAITILSAATSRQGWFPFGNSKIFPNLYTVFVGPSGCGKTQAMRKGKPFFDSLNIGMSPDKSTGAKLLSRMSYAVIPAAMSRDGFTKTPYLIYAEELPSFLGDKAYASGLLADLTALWDCPEPAWIKSTMKDDNISIPHPYVCTLAGTTAQGLFDTLPHNTLGQGFTSRIIFVYAEYNSKRVPVPPYTQRHKDLSKHLLEDLQTIQLLIGPLQMTPAAEELWTDYYTHRAHPIDRFEDDRSQGFASREPIYVLKLSQLNSIAESDDKVIGAHHVQTAIDTVQVAAEQLPLVYATMSASPVVGSFTAIIRLVEKQGKPISHKDLYRKMRYRLDPVQFRMALSGLHQSGDIETCYPNGSMNDPHYRRIK